MQHLSGTIWVDQELRAARERIDERQAWRARQARLALRREETEVLRQWRQATEQDRPEVVRQHREIFARIHENKKRAKAIEREEREILDQRMAALGYAIRTGRFTPRYVRAPKS